MDTEEVYQPRPQENKSAVLVNSTVFKLVETIEKKIVGIREKTSGYSDKGHEKLEELKVLREQCGSENPLISITACHGLVYLVRAFVCPLDTTIAALVSSLFTVKSLTGVTNALAELLILELKCQLTTNPVYCCPYNTKSPQHPLVAVLKRRPLAWPYVLNQLSAICSHPDKQVNNHSLELIKPVISYVLMETNELPDSSRLQMFRIIINYHSDKDFMIEAFASCLCWQESRMLEVVQIVTMVGETAVSNKNGLHVSLCCLALAALVPKLLSAGLTPQPTLQLLSQLASMATNTHSTIMVILSGALTACPSVFLEDLLSFIVELLGRGQCSLDCVWMCVSSLLPWLASSSSHLHKAMHIASMVVSNVSVATASPSTTATLLSNPTVSTIVSADPRLTQAIHIARLSEELRGDSNATLKWIESNKTVELDLVHLYISAMLLSRKESDVRLKALQTLVDSKAPLTTTHNLTLLLYQLAREKEPNNQLALLRALPTTAVDKSNVMGVVSTLEAIRRSGHQSLSLLAVDLYCQLWMCQERCYPQLMDVLNQDCSHFNEPSLVCLLQANICKAICDAKPEMHGKEVVAKVSEILNKCGGVKDSAASALAIEALIPLCCHDVVDVYTICRSLFPRFSRDKRPLVLKSLCELVSVAAVQKSTSTEANDILIQIFKWLWNLVATSKHASVVENALKALSKFRVDQMKLKFLPECFRKGITLPPEMAKTPVDAARKPEDVLEYIPGECWVQVLQHVSSEAASLAIASWIKMEVTSFHVGSLYQVDRQEPVSYNHLPRSSVLRGVTGSLQSLCQSTDADLEVINLCLVTLIQPTPRPLPSLSWTFLNNLADPRPTVELNIIRLAAKQCQISPSARKIVEKYIASCGNDEEKIEFLYSILRDLCRGIPPNILRPFLERTLQTSLNQNDNKKSTLLQLLKSVLKEEKIHEANRTMLHQQVKALWDLIEPQNELLNEYFGCVCELPISVIESMTSTSLMWEVTSAQLQKAFRLRAFMALIPQAEMPLNWVNEIIEVASSNIAEQALALQLVTNVMSQLSRHPTAWAWLQELMGQTHLTTVSNKGGVEFLVTVFMLCVDIMSGYSILAPTNQDTRPLRFPQAVSTLVRQNGEASSMIEWLNHMRGFDSFPSQFTSQFLLAARNVSLILN